jgi:hypothetical protein
LSEIQLKAREEKQKGQAQRAQKSRHLRWLCTFQHVRAHDDAQSDLDYDDGQAQSDGQLGHERGRHCDQRDEKQRSEVGFHPRGMSSSAACRSRNRG